MMTLRRPPRRGFGEQPATLAAIQNLFANGELGGYWPADPAYAYEDSTGTIAASVNGVTGLRHDVSRGLTVGPELITNGTFDSSTGWSIYGNVTISGGTINFNSTTNDNASYNIGNITTGVAYLVSLDLVSRSRGTPYVVIGGSSIVFFSTSIGKKSFVVINAGINSLFYIYGGFFGTGGDAVIDNVSVKSISSYSAIQATTANKPYLRRTPVSGKYWYDSNTDTGALTATFSSSLGSACTIATVTPEGVTIAENQTVGTTYNICQPYNYNSDVLIINRALTAAEKALVTRVMQRSVPAIVKMAFNFYLNSHFASSATIVGNQVTFGGIYDRTLPAVLLNPELLNYQNRQFMCRPTIKRLSGNSYLFAYMDYGGRYTPGRTLPDLNTPYQMPSLMTVNSQLDNIKYNFWGIQDRAATGPYGTYEFVDYGVYEIL